MVFALYGGRRETFPFDKDLFSATPSLQSYIGRPLRAFQQEGCAKLAKGGGEAGRLGGRLFFGSVIAHNHSTFFLNPGILPE